MKNFLCVPVGLILATTISAQMFVVDATGPDTFTTADMHGIEHYAGPPLAAVTIDLGATAKTFEPMFP